MRTHTLTIWEYDTMGILRLVKDHFYEYSGPVDEMKKGRKEQEQLIQDQRNQALQEQSRRTSQLAQMETERQQADAERQAAAAEKTKSDALIAPYENQAPGTMNGASSAQYAADLDNITKTYDSVKEAGLRTLASRGFGRAPSGFTSSFLNTTGQNKANEETNAFRQGLSRTEAQRMTALAYRTGQISSAQAQQQLEQAQEGITGNQASESGQLGATEFNGSSEAALRRSQMGSTLGDIAGGVAGVAGAVGSLAAPGVGGGLSSLSSRLTKLGRSPGKAASGIDWGPVAM